MTVAEALRHLDPAWIDRVLRESGHSQSPLRDLRVEPVAFTGATTDMARLHLSYQGSGGGPSSMIAKTKGTKEVQLQIDQAVGLFGRESHVYGALADRLPVAMPTCYHAGDGDDAPLLLEDLGGLRMGDQIGGLEVDDAQRILESLADLHARFWESPAVEEPWLLSHAGGLYPQLIKQLVGSGMPALEERHRGTVPDAVLDAIVAAAPNWDDLVVAASQGPPTLVHNDCRLDNVFFTGDGDPVFIDWQVVSRTRGTQDVANLLAGSMDPDVLDGEWQRLLQRYHERLVGNEVSGYSLEQATEHYRQNVFFPLSAGIALIGSMDIGDGRGLGDIIVARCLRHIEAIDAIDTLVAR